MRCFRKSYFISRFRLNHLKAYLSVYPPISDSLDTVAISGRHIPEFLAKVATLAHQLHTERGGTIPFAVIKEVVDNSIHAGLDGIIITVFSDGSGIRVSDRGPGIKEKGLATLPGYSTASSWHRKYIRGVGLGLAQVLRFLADHGGSMEITDNINQGAVVTLIGNQVACTAEVIPSELSLSGGSSPSHGEILCNSPAMPDTSAALTDRQRAIITVLGTQGPLGPSKLAEYINSSPSSTYRDLVTLTDLGLLILVDGGRRMLNPQLSNQVIKGIGDK